MIALLVWACASAPTPPPAPPAPPPAPPKSDAIYFVLVDRFADGSPDAVGSVDKADPQAFHGGDIQGVIDQLDHIEGMGFGAVWLSPITQMRTEKIDEWGAFHGYWVSDLGAVEPRFGTMEQAKKLASELRNRDMGLYLDMVYNHVGYQTALTTEHPDWFHGKGDVKDWANEEQVRTHDVHGLPDLAQENPEVYKHLLRYSVHWISELQPTGFRIDAVRHLGAGFLAGFGNDLKAIAGDDFQLLGEVFEGDPVKLARALEADKLTSVFDFPLHYAMRDVFCDGADLGRIASTLAQDDNYGEGVPLVTFLDNHDRPRIGDCDRAPLALAFLLTARGRPSITYGTEIRLKGAEEPYNRGDMRFGEDHDMERDIRTWLRLRGSSPATQSGVSVVHELADDWLLYSRQLGGEALLVAVNLGTEPRPVDIAAILGDVRVEEGWYADDRAHYIRTDPKRMQHQATPEQIWVWRLEGNLGAPETPQPAKLEIEATGLPHPEASVPVLVGSGELGNWNPEHGQVGEWIAEGTARFDIQRLTGEVLAFKMVVRGKDSTWEDRSDRYLLVQESGKLQFTWEK